jgi:hypothetical protein
MILGLQFIAIVFAMVMIYMAYVNFRRKEINRIETSIWVGAWGIALYMVLFPDTLRSLAQTFFISRLLDLMIMGGLVLVITMVALAYVRTRKIEKKLERFIRKEALKEIGKKKTNE